MRVAWLCDFDGTIAPEDIGASWVSRFSPVPLAQRRALLDRWKRGEIGSRELTLAECEGLRCTEREALEFARGFGLDPGFVPFVREATARGDAVCVVSDGFGFYVSDHLDRAGLAHLPRASNRVRFGEDGRVALEFPYPGGCGRCGNCKAQHVRRYRDAGAVTVMVGDGYSDRCGAREADHVLARGGLLEWCREQGVLARPMAGFEDVAAFGRQLCSPAPEAVRPAGA